MKILDHMRVDNALALRWNERLAERKATRAARSNVHPLRREG
jgi:hypothetical protein